MQILLIHQHYYPEQGGTAKTSTEVAEYFAVKGHDVSVITEYPNRSFQSAIDSAPSLKNKEIRNNVKLYRLKNCFTYSASRISRILGYLHFTIASFLKAITLRQRFDVCITVQALPAAIPGVMLQMLKGVKHHFYCTDMMPDLGIVTGLKEKSLAVRLGRIVERLVYDKSYAVYAVTARMADQIRQRTRNSNIYVLSDWLDANFFQENRYKYLDELRNKYCLTEKRVILYIGNIGFLQNLRILVEAGEKLQQVAEFSDCLILIGGSGVEREKLEIQCHQRNINNVRFLGVISREHVPSLMELSDVLVMNYVNHPHMALYRSSKIMDYIIAQKPVVVGAEGELADIVRNHQLGAVARPSDAEDFFEKLKEVLKKSWRIDNVSLIDSLDKNTILSGFAKNIENLKPI